MVIIMEKTVGENFICQSVFDLLKSSQHGALAQLGERLHGMQEVVGSNPIGSIPPFLQHAFAGF